MKERPTFLLLSGFLQPRHRFPSPFILPSLHITGGPSSVKSSFTRKTGRKKTEALISIQVKVKE